MLDLERAKELCEKATPGPWTARGNVLDIQEEARLFCISTEDGLPHVQDENDIAFIATARTALPEALDQMEKLDRVATEARYYLLHGGSLADLERALRDAGYGG